MPGPARQARCSPAGWTAALVEHRDGELPVDLAQVQARKDAIVAASRDGLKNWLTQMPGCTVFRGTARFLSATTMPVGDDVLEATHIFLNIGGRPTSPPRPGVEHVPYLTSSTILGLAALPTHLFIVGAGAGGLKFGSLFRRLGAQVTIVERNPRLLPHDDENVAAAGADILANEGITLRLGAECISLSQEDGQPVVQVSCEEDASPSRGAHLLLAPCTPSERPPSCVAMSSSTPRFRS